VLKETNSESYVHILIPIALLEERTE